MAMTNETIIFENSFSQVIDSIVTGIKKFIRKIIDFFDTAITSIKNKVNEWIQNGGAEDYYTIVKSELFPDGKPADMDDDVYTINLR